MRALAFFGAASITVMLFAVAEQLSRVVDGMVTREIMLESVRHQAFSHSSIIFAATIIYSTVVTIVLVRRRGRTTKLFTQDS